MHREVARHTGQASSYPQTHKGNQPGNTSKGRKINGYSDWMQKDIHLLPWPKITMTFVSCKYKLLIFSQTQLTWRVMPAISCWNAANCTAVSLLAWLCGGGWLGGCGEGNPSTFNGVWEWRAALSPSPPPCGWCSGADWGGPDTSLCPSLPVGAEGGGSSPDCGVVVLEGGFSWEDGLLCGNKKKFALISASGKIPHCQKTNNER